VQRAGRVADTAPRATRTRRAFARRASFDTSEGRFYVPAVRTSYEISLRGLRFHARVGILPHERQLAQPIEIDVTVWPRAAQAEPHVGMLLDYRGLYDLVAGVVAAGPVDFLEGLALSIAERSMDGGNVRRVRVAARKPHVMLPGPVSHAEVTVELHRDE
jgi:dihydroneopterin aldolase